MSLQNPPIPPPPPPPAPWSGPPSPAPGRRRVRLIALAGGVVAVVAVITVTIVVLLTAGNDPEDVAREYLEARFSADYETTCELASEEDQEAQLEAAEAADCEKYAEKMRDREPEGLRAVLADLDVDVRIGEVEEDEDAYVLDDGETRLEERDENVVHVQWGVLRKYTGDDARKAEEILGLDGIVEADDDELSLVKEHGEWRVKAETVAGTHVAGPEGGR